MRTTYDVDPDIFQAIKERAREERRSAGKVLSDLVREAITGSNNKRSKRLFTYKNGVPVLASRGEVITLEHVQRIMDEEGI